MIHQLAGHSQKITSVRLFPGEKSVVTGSADRSLRVWDISRHIYSQSPEIDVEAQLDDQLDRRIVRHADDRFGALRWRVAVLGCQEW